MELSAQEKQCILTDVYQSDGILGQGALGTKVYLGKVNGAEVAIKRLPAGRLHSDSGQLAMRYRRLCKAVAELCPVRHPHVIQLMGVAQPSAGHVSPGLVLDKMDMPLRKRWSAEPYLSLVHEQRVVLQAASGLEYLHAQGIAHCNITADNILLRGVESEQFIVKLTDIGSTTCYHVNSDALSDQPSSRAPFMPPESLGSGGGASAGRGSTDSASSAAGAASSGFESDCYSLGVCVLAMVVRRDPPDMYTLERDGRNADLQRMPRRHPLRSLITGSLSDRPANRLTAREMRNYVEIVQAEGVRPINSPQSTQQGSVVETTLSQCQGDLVFNGAYGDSGNGQKLKEIAPAACNDDALCAAVDVLSTDDNPHATCSGTPFPVADSESQSEDADVVEHPAEHTIPLVAPLDTPLVAPLATPLVAPLDTPLVAPLDTPLVAPLDTPLVAPLDTPLVAPLDTPLVAPLDTPLVAPLDTPLVAPLEAPLVAPLEAPLVAPLEAPLVAPLDTPLVAPLDTPLVAPLDTAGTGVLIPLAKGVETDEMDEAVPVTVTAQPVNTPDDSAGKKFHPLVATPPSLPKFGHAEQPAPRDGRSADHAAISTTRVRAEHLVTSTAQHHPAEESNQGVAMVTTGPVASGTADNSDNSSNSSSSNNSITAESEVPSTGAELDHQSATQEDCIAQDNTGAGGCVDPTASSLPYPSLTADPPLYSYTRADTPADDGNTSVEPLDESSDHYSLFEHDSLSSAGETTPDVTTPPTARYNSQPVPRARTDATVDAGRSAGRSAGDGATGGGTGAAAAAAGGGGTAAVAGAAAAAGGGGGGTDAVAGAAAGGGGGGTDAVAGAAAAAGGGTATGGGTGAAGRTGAAGAAGAAAGAAGGGAAGGAAAGGGAAGGGAAAGGGTAGGSGAATGVRNTSGLSTMLMNDSDRAQEVLREKKMSTASDGGSKEQQLTGDKFTLQEWKSSQTLTADTSSDTSTVQSSANQVDSMANGTALQTAADPPMTAAMHANLEAPSDQSSAAGGITAETPAGTGLPMTVPCQNEPPLKLSALQTSLASDTQSITQCSEQPDSDALIPTSRRLTSFRSEQETSTASFSPPMPTQSRTGIIPAAAHNPRPARYSHSPRGNQPPTSRGPRARKKKSQFSSSGDADVSDFTSTGLDDSTFSPHSPRVKLRRDASGNQKKEVQVCFAEILAYLKIHANMVPDDLTATDTSKKPPGRVYRADFTTCVRSVLNRDLPDVKRSGCEWETTSHGNTLPARQPQSTPTSRGESGAERDVPRPTLLVGNHYLRRIRDPHQFAEELTKMLTLKGCEDVARKIVKRCDSSTFFNFPAALRRYMLLQGYKESTLELYYIHGAISYWKGKEPSATTDHLLDIIKSVAGNVADRAASVGREVSTDGDSLSSWRRQRHNSR